MIRTIKRKKNVQNIISHIIKIIMIVKAIIEHFITISKQTFHWLGAIPLGQAVLHVKL